MAEENNDMTSVLLPLKSHLPFSGSSIYHMRKTRLVCRKYVSRQLPKLARLEL